MFDEVDAAPDADRVTNHPNNIPDNDLLLKKFDLFIAPINTQVNDCCK